MKSVKELLKENRKDEFILVTDNSSSLTADLEDYFIRELLNDELISLTDKRNSSIGEQ